METQALIPLILGVVMPPVIDLVNKYVPNSNARFLVSIVFSLLLGGLIAFFESGWDAVLANAGLVFVSAQAVYKLWYKDSKVHAKIAG